MAVVHVPPAVDRLVVAHGEIVADATRYADEVGIDGYRLDPVDGVLQHEAIPQALEDLERPPGSSA